VTGTGATATIDDALPPPATAQLSLVPPVTQAPIQSSSTGVTSTSSPVGSQITVPIYVDVTSGAVNAAAATVDYPADLLQYDSTQINSAVWGTTMQNSGGAGVVQVATSTSAPQPAGSVLLATITFTALAPGTATLTLDATSSQVADVNNALAGGVPLDALDATAGASYTITP
jgi:hypothetical protein